jgi:hypothetical protein
MMALSSTHSSLAVFGYPLWEGRIDTPPGFKGTEKTQNNPEICSDEAMMKYEAVLGR